MSRCPTCAARCPPMPSARFKPVGSRRDPPRRPATQTKAPTAVITVIVGSGPETKQGPAVARQTVDVAQRNLTVYGFTKVTQTQVDSIRPAGEVIGTNPPKGQTVPVDSIIE